MTSEAERELEIIRPMGLHSVEKFDRSDVVCPRRSKR